jgi:hypothetical protein
MNSFSRSSGKVNWLLLIALLFIFGGGFLAYWTVGADLKLTH